MRRVPNRADEIDSVPTAVEVIQLHCLTCSRPVLIEYVPDTTSDTIPELEWICPYSDCAHEALPLIGAQEIVRVSVAK